MIYPYVCNTCGKTTEVERSIHAEAIAPKCEDCNVDMNRVWIAAPIKFNTTGFYKTDN